MKTARAGSRRNFNWKMKVFAGMLNVLSSRSALHIPLGTP